MNAGWRLAGLLAPAIAALLLAQWPLREFGTGGASVLANDVAQVLFAVYVSIAVAWATRRGVHLSLHAGGAASGRRLSALLPLPWCAWLLVTGAAPAWRAIVALEQFPESFNPGYFVIRAAPVLLAAVLAAESVAAWRRG